MIVKSEMFVSLFNFSFGFSFRRFSAILIKSNTSSPLYEYFSILAHGVWGGLSKTFSIN